MQPLRIVSRRIGVLCLQNLATVGELPGAVHGRAAKRPRFVQDLGRVRCKWGWEDGQG